MCTCACTIVVVVDDDDVVDAYAHRVWISYLDPCAFWRSEAHCSIQLSNYAEERLARPGIALSAPEDATSAGVSDPQ